MTLFSSHLCEVIFILIIVVTTSRVGALCRILKCCDNNVTSVSTAVQIVALQTPPLLVEGSGLSAWSR